VKIGLPREVKDNEYRVGLVPAGVHALSDAGHLVLVERGAGEGSGFSDEEYQGGCSETTQPTPHSDPTYVVDGVVHDCVSNMPGSMPRTSTFVLTNAPLPYVLKIGNLGLKGAIGKNPNLKDGVNIYQGKVTFEPVAQSLNLPCQDLDELL
jgi:alanine dehydrogenase